MGENVTILVSARALWLGAGGLFFFTLCAVGAAIGVFVSIGEPNGLRLGTAGFVVGGVAAMAIVLWLGRIVLTALIRRSNGLVKVTHDSVEVLTRRGRQVVPIGSVAAIGLTGKHRALTIELRDGRRIHPVLRPEGGEWDQFVPALAKRIGVSERSRYGADRSTG